MAGQLLAWDSVVGKSKHHEFFITYLQAFPLPANTSASEGVATPTSCESKDLSVMVNLFERQTRNENEECTQTTPYHKRARRKKKALWTWRHRAAPSKLHASRRGAIPHTQHRKLNTSVDCLRNNHRHCFVSLRLKAAALVHSNSFIH
jgi:hypothetical protein